MVYALIGCIGAQLKLWRCLGVVAEESIETFHLRRNNISKRYCKVRGECRNALIMKALQFESASWTWEGINDIMLKATKSMRAKVVRTQQPTTVEKLLRKKKVMEKSSRRRRRRRNGLIGNYE
mmetsp:Transcript_9916/g.15069  ORF Transcript_9916/g.15069 Transcript_9916/m.15069 type:complete len:123 (-) Transcript_9916:114-482(-)